MGAIGTVFATAFGCGMALEVGGLADFGFSYYGLLVLGIVVSWFLDSYFETLAEDLRKLLD